MEGRYSLQNLKKNIQFSQESNQQLINCQSNYSDSDIFQYYIQGSENNQNNPIGQNSGNINQHIQQQTETLVICGDMTNFQTFNQGNHSETKQSIKQNERNKKRLRLWSTGSNKKQKKENQNEKQNCRKGKKTSLVMMSRKPLQNLQNKEQNNQHTKQKQKCLTSENYSIPICNQNNVKLIEETGKCSQQEFDKLLEITSRCVDYYNTFIMEKDQELKIVREAFMQIQSNLCSAFNNIIEQIKTKQNQIVSFLHNKENELFQIKEKQQERLKSGLQEIRAIHLSNFLLRNGVCFSEKDKSSIISLDQNLQNSKDIIFQKSVSEDIHNYAKTLHNFYEAMEDIQKNSFKENVDETINFINNLITEEVRFIVYQRIPQKSLNCSFSFNNNSMQSGKLFNEHKKSKPMINLQMNNFSLSSPSIATNFELSEPTSPKGYLRWNETGCQLKIKQNLLSKEITETGIQTQKSNLLNYLSQIKDLQKGIMKRQEKIKRYKDEIKLKLSGVDQLAENCSKSMNI